MSAGHSRVNFSEGRLFNNDGEVIPWVGIVEVLVRDPGGWVSNGGIDFEVSGRVVVSENRVIVHWFIVKEISIGDFQDC